MIMGLQTQPLLVYLAFRFLIQTFPAFWDIFNQWQVASIRPNPNIQRNQINFDYLII